MAMSQADQQLIDATNLRSVRRADPNVKSILQTSVYSVVYHYDEVSGKWEKQKQEGPLFVVQRDKSPEWSLYMLNRQAVKNPAIALVPGEMKMTVIDQTMLQVARRGEKQRIGIWFSEGPEVVEKFRTTILGICGEPSKRRDTTPATGHDHVSSPAVVAPQPVAAAEDGLSRLFAGLMKSPPVQSPTVQPKAPTPHRDTTPIQHPPSQPIFSPGPPVPAAPSPIPPPQPPVASPPAQLPSQVSPPPLPPMSSISSPPGQTADDLLMSILGLAPPTTPQPPVNVSNQLQGIQPGNMHSSLQQSRVPPPPPPQLHQQSQQYHQQNLPTHPHAQQYGLPQLQQMPSQAFSHAPMYPPQSQMNQIAQVPPQSQNQPVPPLQYRSKVGDATFAQTAALPLPVPISHTSSPPQPLTARPSPSDNHAAAPPHPSAQNSFQSRQSPETPNGNIRPGTESRGMMADAVAGEVVRKQRDEGLIIAGIGLGAEERKAEFRRRLTDLILTDDRFVDDIWTEYLDRMSRAGQADG